VRRMVALAAFTGYNQAGHREAVSRWVRFACRAIGWRRSPCCTVMGLRVVCLAYSHDTLCSGCARICTSLCL
jgi:hypothetical protein